MAVVDGSMTPTTETAFIPQIWSDGVLAAAEFGSQLQKRVNRRFEKDLRLGNTLNIPRQSNLTTQTKTPGIANTINFEAITESSQSVTVSTQQYAAFLVEGITEVQANQDLRARYEEKIGYAIARGREVAITALFHNFVANIVGTYGVELTYDDYQTAWQELVQAGLMEMSPTPGQDFSVVLSPAAYSAVTKLDYFASKIYNDAADVAQKMVVGDILGAPVYLSNLLNSPAANQHDCAFLHRDSIIMIVQEEIPVQSQYLIRYLGDGVVGWTVFGQTIASYPPETPGGGATVDNRAVLLKTL